ncbi:cache domain-containing protein [Sulfitobacter porphyrae]|uniref:Cache domain-containing protein n=1 Tax=Sulfitobacter porphyrae TaxID=1246864 RepID=A0ABW2B4G4_9RHOB
MGQLQRYRDLAVLMGNHPAVRAVLSEGDARDLGDLLLKVADKTAALDVLVIDAEGRLRASALGLDAPMELAGQPFVRRALRGALGWGHGEAMPLSQRAYFHAAPVFSPPGQVLGAVVVVTDLNGIDYNWRGSNPRPFSPTAAARS